MTDYKPPSCETEDALENEVWYWSKIAKRESERVRELEDVLLYVWREGVTAGDLKDKVKAILFARQDKKERLVFQDAYGSHPIEATAQDENIGAKLHSTMDARVWTEEFFNTIRKNGWLVDKSLDEGLMIGWFANAIMCGWDIAHQRMSEEITLLERDAKTFIEALENPPAPNEEMKAIMSMPATAPKCGATSSNGTKE